jgi:hypothetical protein
MAFRALPVLIIILCNKSWLKGCYYVAPKVIGDNVTFPILIEPVNGRSRRQHPRDNESETDKTDADRLNTLPQYVTSGHVLKMNEKMTTLYAAALGP